MSTRRFATLLIALFLFAAAPAVFAAGTADRDQPGLYVTNRLTKLYAEPSADSKIRAELRPKLVVEVVRVTDQWYQIRSKTGKPGGWIRRSYADPHESRGELRKFRAGIFKLTNPVAMRESPNMDSRKVTTIGEGAEVKVVDKQGSWYRIESTSGNRPSGWIPTMAAKRVRDLDPSDSSEPRDRAGRLHGTPADRENRGERERDAVSRTRDYRDEEDRDRYDTDDEAFPRTRDYRDEADRDDREIERDQRPDDRYDF